MNIQSYILIFSVFQNTTTKTNNEQSHFAMLKTLEALKVPHKELDGLYKGSREKSILVVGLENEPLVKTYCDTFNQDCYLRSHSDRSTELVFDSGKIEPIGKLLTVSRDEALKHDSFSSDDEGRFYITKAV